MKLYMLLFMALPMVAMEQKKVETYKHIYAALSEADKKKEDNNKPKKVVSLAKHLLDPRIYPHPGI